MNYEIIKDEKLFREFIEWLPGLQENEKFYLACFARKKYCAEIKYIKSDKIQVTRKLVTKENLFNKVQQMECPVGSYVIKDIVIPQEALSMYISINPRDLFLGAKNSLIKLAQLLTQPYNGYNPHAEVMSEIHRARSRKLYMDFDFDDVDISHTQRIVREFINEDCLTFIKTIGGFHMLVEFKKIEKQYEKYWYKKLTSLEGVDVKGDNLIPVVGCTQGNFTPHFVDF